MTIVDFFLRKAPTKNYDLYGTIYEQSMINLVGKPGERQRKTPLILFQKIQRHKNPNFCLNRNCYT